MTPLLFIIPSTILFGVWGKLRTSLLMRFCCLLVFGNDSYKLGEEHGLGLGTILRQR
ncbi:hypothetical protein LINPERHAP1_LOCUS17360 [Linum perenne]